jgi:hypothetical protein
VTVSGVFSNNERVYSGENRLSDYYVRLGDNDGDRD